MEADVSDEEVWQLEMQFWRGDAELYERALAETALMVFPRPIGVLDRAATVESIRNGPRWENIAFREQRLLRPASDTVVLVYTAQADRGTSESIYRAQCSSTYVRTAGEWQLALHHQTPAADGTSEGGD